MGKICLQCGDRGSTNAFVYCVKCLKFAVHRYCLAVIPETLDEFVHWLCDDCDEVYNKPVERFDHDVIPSQTKDHIASENIKGTKSHIVPERVNGFCRNETTKSDEVYNKPVERFDHDVIPSQTKDHIAPERVNGFCRNETTKSDLLAVRKEDDVKKDGPEKSKIACSMVDLVSYHKSDKELPEGFKKDDDRDMLLPTDEREIRSKENGTLTRLTRLLKRPSKKIKKKKRSRMKPAKEKGEHTSCERENKESVKMVCDIELPSSIVKDNKQRDQRRTSLRISKNKKKKIIISSKENLPENKAVVSRNKRAKERTGFECDTKLPSYRVKDNKGSNQRDQKQIPLKSSKKKKRKRKTIISSEENLLENKAVVSGNQCAEEKKGFECDTKLLCKEKEDNKDSERRDKKCISLKSSKKKKRKTVASSENKPIELENQCAEDSPEEKEYGPIKKPHIGNEDREKREFSNCDKNNIPEDFPKDLHISSAEPVAMPIWRGRFSFSNEKRCLLNGIMAHVSVLACHKVYDEAVQFQPVLHLEMLPKSDVWPKSFEASEPRGDNIALYFFPSKSSEQDFDRLVSDMMRKELALKAVVQNAELLIFNSSELPLLYWKFQGKYFLWGVFRQKQNTPSNSHPKVPNPAMKHTTSATIEGLHASSPRSPLSNSASYGSHT